MKTAQHPQIKIQGRQYTILHTIISIFSLGFFHIIKRHLPFLNYYFTIPCPLEQADYILCLTNKKIYEVQKIVLKKKSVALKKYIQDGEIRLLEVMHHRLLFDFSVNEFVKVNDCTSPLDQLEKFILYGENVLNIKQKSNLELIFHRLTDWTFLYELWCIIIWYYTDYGFYATIILAMNLFYLLIEIQKDIKSKMTAPVFKDVEVVRNKITTIKENCLFPGDTVILDVGEVAADIEILNGEVVVDESFLTGESIPLCRTKGTLIYAGTKVLKTVGNGDIKKVKNWQNIEKLRNIGLPTRVSRSSSLESRKSENQKIDKNGNEKEFKPPEVTKAIGIVKKTGFETYRGTLMRDMISCPETVFPFMEQYNILMLTIVLIFFFLAIMLFIYYELISKKLFSSLVYGNDMFLIAISPALFVSLKLGMVICDQRLKKFEIFVKDLNRLNGVGYVQTIVFDKTGTLTNEDLDILCVDELKYLGNKKIQNDEIKEKIKNDLEPTVVHDEFQVREEKKYEDENDEFLSEKYRSSTSEVELYKKVVEMQRYPDKNFSNMTKIGLSVCHTIMEVNGKLLGDPLDLKMFEFSGSELKERTVYLKEGLVKVEIVKANEFTSSRRMMSVVVDEILFEEDRKTCFNQDDDELNSDNEDELSKDELNSDELKSEDRDKKTDLEEENVLKNKRRYLFAKGSPEAILEVVANAPPHYQDIVNYYALEGFRVISMAYKKINSADDESETNLNFLGFLVFSNQLKNATRSVIRDLRSANLKCKMATGDGILTAISVATQCGLIDRENPVIFPKMPENARSLNDIDWMCLGDHDLYFDKVRLALIAEDDEIEENFAIACEGKLYEKIRDESELYHNFLLSKGVVFARMNPDQKKFLVEDLQKTKTTVCFCGDGANDSSALTAADVGISLNTEQQFFAGFTSKIKDIGCVIHVIREGRAALVSSISNFRLQILISIIQFFACALLSFYFLFPSETQTSHYDFLFVLISAYILSSFKTSAVLHKEEPKIEILSKAFLIPLIGHLLIDLVFAGGIFLFFKEPISDYEFRKESVSATISFFITMNQGILALYFFAEGKPHRESKFTNLKFISFIFFHISFLLILLFGSAYFETISRVYSFVWANNFQRIFVVLYWLMNLCVLAIFHSFVDRVVCVFSKKSNIQRKTERYEEFI